MKMKTIKKITISQNNFIIESDKTPLKFNCSQDKERFIIDISTLNIFEAVKIAILSSTYCFLNNFEKKLCWLVKDEQTRKAISILRLHNMEQFVKNNTIEKTLVSA